MPTFALPEGCDEYARKVTNAARGSHPTVLGLPNWPMSVSYRQPQPGWITVTVKLLKAGPTRNTVALLVFQVGFHATGWGGPYAYYVVGNNLLVINAGDTKTGQVKLRFVPSESGDFTVPKATSEGTVERLKTMSPEERQVWLDENQPTFEFLQI